MASIDEHCSALVFSDNGDIPFSESNMLEHAPELFTALSNTFAILLDQKIEIICITLTGKEIKLTIDPTNTILNIKKNIYKKTDIMIKEQK
jgi:hypothetical protein